MYKYDKQGKLIGWYSYDSSDYTNKIGGTLIYDGESRITSNSMHFDYETLSGLNTGYILYSYSYDEMTDNLARMAIIGSWITGDIEPEYDYFGRTTERVIDINQSGNAFYNKLTYSYKKVNGYETGLVSQLVSERRLGDGTSVLSTTTYNYTYDANGNITQITDANGVIQNKYYYDGLGQLIREDNKALNMTWVYTYDNAGNITAKKPYSYSTGALGTAYSVYNFSYSSSDWGDKLTYGNYESILSYDAIGNPTNVFDGMSGYELTWQGRQLKSYQAYEDDFDSLIYGDTITFTYNADGIRTSKTVNGVKHEYHLNGSQIVFETWIEGNVEHFILYLYDETGAPIGLSYRNSSLASGVYHTCFFEKNLLGDIVAVYNSSGTVIGTYIYDAWGECTYKQSAAASALERNIARYYNPFRYRGYFYDVETKLYYLQTRYYNPGWCRFINADGYINANGDMLGYNMFAYCGNNPIMNIDPNGEFSLTVAIIITLACATVGAIIGACSDEKLYETPKQTIAQNDTYHNQFGQEGLSDSDNLKEEPAELTVSDRIKNGIVGFCGGLLVGGAIVSTAGVAGSLIVGSGTTAITAFGGATGAQMFAAGALAFDAGAFLSSVLFGVDIEPIECEPIK